eukprot:TRINITY_DN721_c1_g1_i1.p1 TRINITY_DN721_c1_g1~~TRINITY_DN721_c1_g1_i1.p1  ORF type:complete len:680 (+),score=196.57 TRINITY_DN721_c1_g1_i1:197-2236(+)
MLSSKDDAGWREWRRRKDADLKKKKKAAQEADEQIRKVIDDQKKERTIRMKEMQKKRAEERRKKTIIDARLPHFKAKINHSPYQMSPKLMTVSCSALPSGMINDIGRSQSAILPKAPLPVSTAESRTTIQSAPSSNDNKDENSNIEQEIPLYGNIESKNMKNKARRLKGMPKKLPVSHPSDNHMSDNLEAASFSSHNDFHRRSRSPARKGRQQSNSPTRISSPEGVKNPLYGSPNARRMAQSPPRETTVRAEFSLINHKTQNRESGLKYVDEKKRQYRKLWKMREMERRRLVLEKRRLRELATQKIKAAEANEEEKENERKIAFEKLQKQQQEEDNENKKHINNKQQKNQCVNMTTRSSGKSESTFMTHVSEHSNNNNNNEHIQTNNGSSDDSDFEDNDFESDAEFISDSDANSPVGKDSSNILRIDTRKESIVPKIDGLDSLEVEETSPNVLKSVSGKNDMTKSSRQLLSQRKKLKRYNSGVYSNNVTQRSNATAGSFELDFSAFENGSEKRVFTVPERTLTGRPDSMHHAPDLEEKFYDNRAEAINAALFALHYLNYNQLRTLVHTKRPPPLILKVIGAVCVILGEKPTMRGAQDLVIQSDIMEKFKEFNNIRSSATNKSLEQLAKFLLDPFFSVNRVMKLSVTAGCLCAWVIAVSQILMFDQEKATTNSKLNFLKM